MRAFALAAVVLLAVASACGKYGPPVRREEPAPTKPAPVQPDTDKSQDPNTPAAAEPMP